jgi:hypothetical protein
MFIPISIRIMSMAQVLFRYRLTIQHWRFSLAKLVFSSSPEHRIPLDLSIAPFNHFKRCFECCEWSPSSFNGQTTRVHCDLKDKELTVSFFTTTPQSRFYSPIALGIWVANWEIACTALDGSVLVSSGSKFSEKDGDDADVVWRGIF